MTSQTAVEQYVQQHLTEMVSQLVEPILDLQPRTKLRLDDPYEAELQRGLMRLFQEWKQQTIRDVVESAAVAVACLADETLQPEYWLTPRERSPINKSSSPPRHPDQPPQPASGQRKRKFVNVEEGLGDLTLNAINEVATVHDDAAKKNHAAKSSGRSATIPKRELARFVLSEGYRELSSNGPHEIWKNESGAGIAIPRGRGDLTRQTTAQLLKTLSGQLGREVGIDRGHVVYLEEAK